MTAWIPLIGWALTLAAYSWHMKKAFKLNDDSIKLLKDAGTIIENQHVLLVNLLEGNMTKKEQIDLLKTIKDGKTMEGKNT